MTQQTNGIYEFGSFRLDRQERLLLRDGATISLTPKAFDLLLALIQRHGRLVEKEELFKAVWPDSFVEESNLSSNIALIRKALGDGMNGARYIETVPKRGYRFVAEVQQLTDEPPPREENIASTVADNADPNHPANAPPVTPAAFRFSLSKRHLFITLAFIFVITAGAWIYFKRQPTLADRDTILLADFENQTGDAIFDGMLRQGLAIQLQQSPFLNFFPEPRVRQTLREMNRRREKKPLRLQLLTTLTRITRQPHRPSRQPLLGSA